MQLILKFALKKHNILACYHGNFDTMSHDKEATYGVLVFSFLTLKEPWADFYISAGCYFFALKLHDFFFQALH